MPGLNSHYEQLILLIIWGLMTPLAALAQQEPLEVSLHYGHPDVVLESVTADKDQRIYLATNYGFFVFDGRNLNEISWLAKNGLVSEISVAGDSLLIGYQSGELTIASVRQKSIIRTDTIVNDAIGQIEVTNNGSVILGTAGRGIHLVSPEGIRDSLVIELSDAFINDLFYDRENFSITTATDRGIDRISIQSNKLEFAGSVDAENYLMQSVVPDIDDRSNNLLAFGHSLGLGVIEGGKWRDMAIVTEEPVRHGVLLNTLGHLWLIFNRQEIRRISGNPDHSWSAQSLFSFQSESILEVLGLKEGYLMVWMKNGQLYLIPTTYNHFDRANNVMLNGISAVCPSSSGGVWVARGDSLMELSLVSGAPKIQKTIKLQPLQDFPIISMSERGEFLLAGSFGDGLFIIDLKENQLFAKVNDQSGLDNNSILDIANGRSETWVSTMKGVHGLHLESATQLISLSGAPGYVYCLDAAPNGRLYIGSQGESMFMNNGNEIVPVTTNDTSTHSIISIEQDAAGRVWGLTTESQLFNYSESEVIPHPLNEQLQKLGAYRVFMSPLGHLGLISENSLFDLTAEGIAYELLGGPALFKSDFQNILAVDSKNNLWLARPDGIVLVEEHAMASFHFPETNFDAVVVDGEKLNISEAGEFGHDVRDFSFELKSVWHDPYRPVVREYRLLGLDTTWRTIVDTELHFARLSPGLYSLELRTLFGPTMNRVHDAVYSFTIAPPFYSEWWFIGLSLILLSAILVLGIRRRERRMAMALALKTERIQTQFEVLKNQINPHFLFNSFNTLAALIPDDPQKAERFTEKLSAFFREVLTTQDQETNTLERELELAADFIYLQQARYGDNLEYVAKIDPSKLKCQVPTLALQILLENAVKHNQISKASPLVIKVQTEDKRLIVTNNLQPRPTTPESTGLGLNNLSNRLQILMREDLGVEQIDGTFKVTIPLVQCD